MDTNPDRGYNRYDPTDKPRNEGTAIAPDGDDRRIALEGYPEIRLHLQMIRLTEEDLRLISLMQPFIAANQDQLADSFYECILQTDNLREIFSKHVDMGHLRAALSDHIIAMFAGRIDESYIERRFRIAVFHQKVGVPPKWYITLYQNLLTILLSFVHEISDRLSDVERMRQAITKLISFEQQLGLEAYEQRSQNEERKAKAVIEYQVLHDELTGLPNRRMFSQELQRAIARNAAGDKHIAVLMLDIDRFKIINDAVGHTYGDLFLQEMARRLKQCKDGLQITLARMGGDEFAVIYEHDGEWTDTIQLAERMLNVCEKPYHALGTDFYVTASIGIAIYPQHGEEAEQLLKNADKAMYAVKKNGKNGYRFFAFDQDEQLLLRIELESDLRKAVKRNELVLHYQPQFDTETNTLIGVEALVRWNHPTRGQIPPGVFIPIAEETGLIDEIGTWTLREACRQMKEWHMSGGPLIPVAVNLSSDQFHQANLVAYIRQILNETGLDPAYLQLEITESIMADAKESTDILRQLERLGIKISLDDFGTGYSSLSYLRQFPIHKLKIDRSFISDITENECDQAIVSTIIAMARQLKLEVIAEGIETKGQLDFLVKNRCKEIQGFYFSRPLPAEEVAQAFIMGK